eukprot:COSAG02_NODE_1438_length_12604_cov_27.849580_13_plen_88_part_00
MVQYSRLHQLTLVVRKYKKSGWKINTDYVKRAGEVGPGDLATDCSPGDLEQEEEARHNHLAGGCCGSARVFLRQIPVHVETQLVNLA